MNLLASTGAALDTAGVLPITDFTVKILSRFEAEISYDLAGQTIPEFIVDINVEYEPKEGAVRDCPGSPARAEIIDIFSLNIAERDAYDKWELDNDIEEELLHAIEGDKR